MIRHIVHSMLLSSLLQICCSTPQGVTVSICRPRYWRLMLHRADTCGRFCRDVCQNLSCITHILELYLAVKAVGIILLHRSSYSLFAHPEWCNQQLYMIQLVVLRAGSISRLGWSCLCGTEWFHMCYQHVNVCYFILLSRNCFDRNAFTESLWVDFFVFWCCLLSPGCELRYGRLLLEFIS